MSRLYLALWTAEIVALTLVPVLVLRYQCGAGWRWFFLGMASWAAAYVVKLIALGLLQTFVFPGLPSPAQAALAGAVSGLAELGFAALFLAWLRLRLTDILAFGVGIGALEAVWVLFEGWVTSLVEGPAGPLGPETLLVYPLERVLAMTLHAATRLLVYVALHDWRPGLLLVPLLVFILADGGASLVEPSGWRWEDPLVLGGYYGGLAVVTAGAAWAAWCSWRRWERRCDA